MRELELSVMSIDSPGAEALRAALAEFEAQTGIRVRLRLFTWQDARVELVKFATYSEGPDVSEIGSTWLCDFVGMNSVRPFSPKEIDAFGGPSVFVPAAWESIVLPEHPGTWAIPWWADVRVLYYRRDLLEQAGVDEQHAFATPEAMDRTLGQLQANGVETPWVVPTQRTWMTLHNAASWVWNAGGDFVSADGKQLLFDEPEARAGFKAYFALGRYLPGKVHGLTDTESDRCFWQGEAAVTLSGPWLLHDPAIDPALLPKVGLAFPPGIPFVGGSHLVVWSHARYVHEVLRLVRFLASTQFQEAHGRRAGLLPARLDALSDSMSAPQMSAERLERDLLQGRSFRSVPLWGLIESRLVKAVAEIWEDVLQHPTRDLDVVLNDHLTPLVRRLDFVIRGV
jgi:multiple sugar transport system substrate-binding protein